VNHLKHILIVDGEKLLIDLLARVLPGDRVQVLSATSSDEARRNMAAKTVDVLLINPATERATQLIAEIKRANSRVFVLALTESPEQEGAATRAGMEFVRKSGPLAELLRAMEVRLNTPLAASPRIENCVERGMESMKGAGPASVMGACFSPPMPPHSRTTA
jgi:DNA-binding response OmpR family regulator